jgi:hypothetical protein
LRAKELATPYTSRRRCIGRHRSEKRTVPRPPARTVLNVQVNGPRQRRTGVPLQCELLSTSEVDSTVDYSDSKSTIGKERGDYRGVRMDAPRENIVLHRYLPVTVPATGWYTRSGGEPLANAARRNLVASVLPAPGPGPRKKFQDFSRNLSR